jgi:glycosyltransferase involved in cell wall biosynthesis
MSPRLCVLTTTSTNDPFGRVTNDLARAFAELNVSCDIVYVRDARDARINGPVRIIGLGSSSRSAVVHIARYLADRKPAVTFATPSVVAPATLLAGKLTGQLVVPWEQTFFDLAQRDHRMRHRGSVSPRSGFRMLRSWFAPMRWRLSYRWASGIAAVSTGVAEYMRHAHALRAGSRIYHLANPIDVEDVLAKAAGGVNPWETSGFTMCAAGRLVRQKGFDLLLVALAQRRGELPSQWSLTILGDGGLREQLADLARELGLSDRVRFGGHLANPYPVMSDADLFVHPARYEGFGLVVTEALALGVPVLATACDGPSEILDGGRYGWLIPPEDPTALGEALVQVAGNDEERLALTQAGPQRARAFSPASIATQMLRIAEDVQALSRDQAAR